MARKKKQTVIPDWFDLKNYDACKNFTSRDWGLSFKFRYSTLMRIENIQPHGSNTPIAALAIKNNFLRKIQDNPITCKDEGFKLFDLPFRDFLSSKQNENTKGLTYSHLSSLTLGDASSIHSDFEDGNLFKYIFNIDQKDLSELTSEQEKQYENYLGEVYDEKVDEGEDGHELLKSLKKYHLVLNLSATDETLKAQFACWLKVARKKYEFSESKTITKDAIRKLNDKRILPFIDIAIWRILTNTDMPKRELYELLYPDYDHVAGAQDNHIVSVQNLANTCLTTNYINALLHLEQS